MSRIAKAGLLGLGVALAVWLLRRGPGAPPAEEMQATKPAPPASEPALQGYCVKERKKVRIKDPEGTVTKNGRSAVKGTCPDCGTTIFRFV